MSSSINKEIETVLKDKGYAKELIADIQDILHDRIHVVPYDRLSEEISKRREIEKSSQEYASSLEQLRADNTALKDDIHALKAELRASAIRHEVETKLIKVGAKDAHLLMKCLNFDKIQRGDDGLVTGLDEQIEKLQSTAPYMFEIAGEAKRPQETPYTENVKAAFGDNTAFTSFHGVEPAQLQSPAPTKSEPEKMTVTEALRLIAKYGH